MLGIAAFSNSNVPEIVDLPLPPPPKAGEILCRTLQLGVCGTDREILASLRPATPPGADFLVLGHECLAQVENLGPGVKGFSPGDLVVPLVRRPIGQPRHRSDLLTPGEFIERGILRAHGFSASQWIDTPQYLLPIPPEIVPLAILAEPTSIAEKGINESIILQEARLGKHVWRDEPPHVLITGMGPIGFMAVVACLCRGWPVTHFGRDPGDSFRAQLSKQFGAIYTSQIDAPTTLDGIIANPFDLVLECTGNEDVMLNAAQAMSPRSVMVWLGSSRQPAPNNRNIALLMRQGLVRNSIFIGSVNSAVRDFHDALAHLAQMDQQVPNTMSQLITDKVKPTNSLGHYTHRQPQGIKTIVTFD